MVAAHTTDDLVTEVKELITLPDADARLGDTPTTGILRAASRCLTTDIADLLVSTRQTRWVTSYADITLSAGTSRYRIPPRALGGTVDDVVAAEVMTGTNTDLWRERTMPEIDARDRPFMTGAGTGLLRGGWGAPVSFTWEGDFIIVMPAPDASIASSYKLRIRYPRQPARLVPVASCAIITAVGGATVTATSAQTILGAAPVVDIVQGSMQADVLGMDLTTAISGGTVTVSVPTDTAIGDYVCPAGYSCVVPAPEACWPSLVVGTAIETLLAINDTQGAQDLSPLFARRFEQTRNILQPRARQKSKPILNRMSALRMGRRRGWL